MVCRRNFGTGNRVWGRKCLLHFVERYCKKGVVYEYCSIDKVEGVFRRKTGDIFEDFLVVTGLTICVKGIDGVSQFVFNFSGQVRNFLRVQLEFWSTNVVGSVRRVLRGRGAVYQVGN